MTKDTARTRVQELVHKFQHDPDRHKHGERQTDERYILPLFRALGWDTASSDVTVEEQIKSGRADYGLYVHGVPQFYLETKRPDRRLDERSRMEQAINYAYLKGVAWAVLTDFDRLMVFNADLDEDDPTKARLLDLRFNEYVDRFDDVWLLSRDAMQERPRPIDILATRYGKKAKREPITQALFNDLADWRRDLFEDIRAYRPTDRAGLDNELQKFFDRLIFLRTLEDRGVEKPLLKEIVRTFPKTKGKQAFNELLRQFRELDKLYNSNLFALHPLDELVVHNPNLIETILNGLYGNSKINVNYDFGVISADVLGAVYEQYLSFKATDPADARKTKPTKSAKRTHKRNNQGIYYTPQYVVRHIVQATLTPVLARMGKDAHKITVLDPACGSGAFLIEVFDVLERHFKLLDPTVPDRERRERILKENLFGVDLDEQAVEVTRLNLVLRAAYERQKLPMLEHIQHGNSLVEADEVAGAGLGTVWEDRFPLVMANGGFDVVVGNPPYVRQEYLPAAFKEYAQARYTTMNGTADLYVPFVEQGFRLLKEGGRLGYILPNKWLRAKYGQNLRGYLADKVEQLIDFGDLPVFADATTYPLIFTLHKSTQPLPPPTVTQARSLPTYATESLEHHLGQAHTVPRHRLTAKQWELGGDQHASLLDKLKHNSTPLGEYVNGGIYRGVVTGYNKAFVIDAETRKQLIARDPRSAEVIKPYLRGRDVKRWGIDFQDQYLLYIPWHFNLDEYPAIQEHLLKFHHALSSRPEVKEGRFSWYAMSRYGSGYVNEFEKPKIVWGNLATSPQFALDDQGMYINAPANIICRIDKPTLLYILGILNSNVTKYIIELTGATRSGGFIEYKPMYVSQIPIPKVEAELRERIRGRVEKIMGVQRELSQLDTAQAKNLPEQATLKARLAEYETLLNALVYEAYGLTAEEVEVVCPHP